MIKSIQNDLKYINIYIVSMAMLLIILSAYGYATFNIQIVIDDWTIVTNPNYVDQWLGKIGRWGQFIYRKVFILDTTFPPSATMLFALVFMSASALLFQRLIQNHRANNLSVIYFCALFIICPILLNPFIFKLIRVPFAVGVFLIMISVYYIKYVCSIHTTKLNKLVAPVLLASFMIMCAVSVRQSLFLAYIAVIQIIIMSTLIKDKQEPYLKKYLISLIIMGITTLVMYVILHYSLMKITGSSPVGGRAYSMSKSLISSLDQLPFSVRGLFFQMKYYYFTQTNYWPIIIKYLFLASYILLIILSLRRMIQQKKSLLYRFIFIFISISLLVTPFLLGVIRDPNIPGRYRETSLSTLILFYPAVYILLYSLLNNSKMKMIVHIIFGYIVVIWIFQLNASSLTQHYMNQRDIITHNQIMNDLQEMTKWPASNSVKVYNNLALIKLGD